MEREVLIRPSVFPSFFLPLIRNGQVHKKIKVAADSETVPSITTTADEQTAAGASADVHMASPKRSQSRSRSPEKRTSLLSADATATEAAKERSRSRSRSKSPARAPVTPAASEEMTMSIDTPGETKATVPLPDVTTTAARRSPSPTRMDSVVEAAAAVPASAATVAPLAAPTTAFTATPESMRFAYELVRGLKKRKDAGPFLLPVDPVALGIPQYFDVVKQPMDLSTVEKNLRNGSYKVLDELIADVQLIFHNCYIFNPPDHIVYKMGQGLEQSFHNQLKKLPAALVCHWGMVVRL